MRRLLLLPTVLSLALVALPALAQSPRTAVLPNAGVMFDDFLYDNADWVREDREGQTPPRGSLFGYNAWQTSEAGDTGLHRAWYQYLWQERSDVVPKSIHASRRDGGRLRISIDQGTYPRPREHVDPHVVSGLAARRGTWAARVQVSELDAPTDAGLIQAFWVQAPAVVRTEDGSIRWNEADFEWNNRFRGETQERPYMHTGYTVGRADHVVRTLAAPGSAQVRGQAPQEWTWSCNFVDSGQTRVLREAECNARLLGRHHNGSPLPATMVIRVSDDGVDFEIRADMPDGRLVARSHRGAPQMVLPLLAFFSQHVSPGSVVRQRRDLEVDWFYYTPDLDVGIDDIHEHVSHLRNVVGAARFNSTGLRLERPDRPLPGEASTYGYGNLTTPLDLDFSLNPPMMPRGSSAQLTALPPLRHGSYRYEWRYRTRDRNGRTSTWSRMDGHFVAQFTFPRSRNVVEVEFEVRLSELADGVVLDNQWVRPITRSFTISAGG